MLQCLLATAAATQAPARPLPANVCTADGSVRYFAFGSNLLRSKMDTRGETEVIDVKAATVPGQRLAFNMRMFPPLEPAMASLEPCEGDTCEGALYTLTRQGYESLWRSEGGSMERPGYEEVVVSTSDGEQAITLRAAPWMRMRTDAPPSERYKQIILQGATELGLSESYLARLKAVPSAKPSAALTAIARAHGVVAVLLFRLKLRNALLPLRAASYALLRGKRDGAGLANRVVDVAAETALALLLTPTAILGFIIRSILRAVGREKWVTFGPPPQAKESKPAEGGDDAEARTTPSTTAAPSLAQG